MKVFSNCVIGLGLLLLSSSCFSDPQEQVNDVLDTLHSAAATANWDAYFGVYDPQAIFIGTDASETWTISEFKAYAKPAFDNGKGWTYHSYNRHVYFSKDKTIAWFDEMLKNASLGTTRGTGVLEKTDAGWKVVQYHLTLPIPNSLADEVADKIKQYESEL